jgi:hypothetical protein
MAGEREQTVARLRQRLLAEARPAGWGYYTGKTSRIEPTCWALLALGGTWSDGDWQAFARQHVSAVTERQRDGGLLVESDPLANLAVNGLALVCLTALSLPGHEEPTARLKAGIVGLKGVKLPQGNGTQNDTLQGWPWVRDTFSWVEPTAWCTLGLKKRDGSKRSGDAAPRVDEAERLLLDRICTTGGWNYGNASTLGQDLRPYVPTTAIALLAMQDRGSDQGISRSSEWLAANRLSESSTLALSLASMSLKMYGLTADDVDMRLTNVVSKSEASGHLLGIAMAAYALSADRHKLEALRVRA